MCLFIEFSLLFFTLIIN